MPSPLVRNNSVRSKRVLLPTRVVFNRDVYLMAKRKTDYSTYYFRGTHVRPVTQKRFGGRRVQLRKSTDSERFFHHYRTREVAPAHRSVGASQSTRRGGTYEKRKSFDAFRKTPSIVVSPVPPPKRGRRNTRKYRARRTPLPHYPFKV